MKPIIIIFILLFIIISYSLTTHSPTPQSLIYTTFIAYYPDSQSLNQLIYLRGDACNLTWSKGLPLTKTGQNQWKTALMCPDSSTVNVKLLLNDTVWMMGKNIAFAGDRTITIYPSFKPKINGIEDTTPINSKYLNNSRKCSVYLPPSYYDNTLKSYEVLLLHDGQNLFDNKKAAFGTAWAIQDTLNTLIPQGSMREIIVVGVWNTNQRNNEYTYSYDPTEKFGGKGDLYLDFLQKQLIPWLESSTLKGRIIPEYSIGGSSLGGLISCYATATRSTLFKKSICMSSSFWWNNRDFEGILSFKPNTMYYVDSGNSGAGQDGKNDTISIYQDMVKDGYIPNKNVFYFLDDGGQHSEYYWGKRFNIPMKLMFP